MGDGFEAGRTLGPNLYKVHISVGSDDDAECHLVAYLERLGFRIEILSILHEFDGDLQLTRSLVVQTVHIFEVLCIDGTPRDDRKIGSRSVALDAEIANRRSDDCVIDISTYIPELFGQEACGVDGSGKHTVVDTERTLQAMWTRSDFLAIGLITCKQEVECTEGVHLVVPCLCLLLTQEPNLHFVEELLLIGARRLTDGAHSGQLGRNAVVTPRIVCLVGSIVASHTGLRDGVFNCRLQEVVGTLGMAKGAKHTGCHGASVDGEVAYVLLNVTQIGFAHGADLLAHLVVGSKRTGVEVAERIVAGRDGEFLADAVLVVFEFLVVKEVQPLFEHLGLDIESLGTLGVDQHGEVLTDGERHVVTTGHSFEPTP